MIPKNGTNPSSRYGAQFVTFLTKDSKETISYLFGGLDSHNNYCTVGYVFISHYGWIPLPFSSVQKLPPRIKFATSTVDTYIYLFGGVGPDGPSNELYKIDCSSMTCELVHQQNHTKPMYDMAYATDPNNTILYIFGGWFAGEDCNRLYKLDLNSYEWTDLTNNEAPENKWPPARRGAQMFYYKGYLFLFGGLLENGTVEHNNTIWRCKVNNNTQANDDYTIFWEKINPDNIQDPNHQPVDFVPCFDVGFISLDDVAFLSPGRTIVNSNIKSNAILYFLSFYNAITESIDEATVVCRPVPFSSNNIPVDSACGLFLEGADLVFFSFGGMTDDHVSGDLIYYEIDESKELTVRIEQTNSSTVPSPRAHHSCVAANGKMWVFGGVGRAQNTLLSSDGQTVVYFNDLHSFDLLKQNESYSDAWRPEGLKSKLHPPARAYACMCEHGGMLYLFGGMGFDETSGESVMMQDLWMYSIKEGQWSKIETPQSNDDSIPTRRYKAGMAIVHHNIFVFGGITSDNWPDTNLYKYSLVTHKWSKCNPEPYTPTDGTEAIIEWRSGPILFNMTVDLDKNGIKSDVLVVAGGVRLSGIPIDKPIVFVLPKDIDHDSVVQYLTDINEPTNPNNTHIYDESLTAFYGTGLMSFFGVSSQRPIETVTKVDLFDLKNINFTIEPIGKVKNPPYGASGVYYGRTVYLFGGLSGWLSSVADSAYLNTIYALTLPDESLCSPGTYPTPQAPSLSSSTLPNQNNTYYLGDGCSVAPPGTFTSIFNQPVPTKCLAGSYSDHPGGTSDYHCTLCKNGEYSNETGTPCQPCANSQCLPGSTLDQPQNDPVALPRLTPGRLTQLEKWDLAIQLGLYIGALVIGIIVGFLLLCLPTRRHLHQIDLFSTKHNNPVDPHTHSSPLIVRNTAFGGFVAVVFVIFSLGIIGYYIVQFAGNNLVETKTLISHVMEEYYNFEEVSVPTLTVNITLLKYTGKCAVGPVDKDSFSDCDSALNANNQTPELRCQNRALHPDLLYNPLDCIVLLHADDVHLFFQSDTSVPSIQIQSETKEAAAYGVIVTVETDSGIIDKKIDQRKSRVSEKYIQDTKGEILKGPNSTVFSFNVSGSVFVNQNDKPLYGMQVLSSSVTRGSYVSPEGYYSNFGLNVTVELRQVLDVIRTEWKQRQSPPEVLSNALGTLSGLVGAFGWVVLFAEILGGLNLPCGLKVNKRLARSLSVIEENDLTQPLNSDPSIPLSFEKSE